MPKLQLESLQCLEQEDITGVDSCCLTIDVDEGADFDYMFKNMRRGDVWDINRTVPFEEKVCVGLTELDSTLPMDADDKIDEFEVWSTGANRTGAKVTLVGDGAEYWLQYSLDGCSGVDHTLVTCVASLNSAHYQQPTCHYASRIRQENMLEFNSIEAAQRSHRHACKACSP